MGTPTRFFNGLSTAKKGTILGDFPFPDPFHTASSAGKDVAVYENDFTDLGNTASRTITGVSTTFALADGLGGVGVLTPGGATTASSIYRTAAAFQFASGNKFWFVQRLKYSAVGTGITGYFGLIKTGAATTDSLLFVLAATGVLSFVSTVDNTATTLVAAVTTIVADTFVDVGFYYDGAELGVYVEDQLVARVSNPTIGATATTLTNELLTPITQITPAATETVTLDYALIAQELSR
jgi:hypothetical protein